jgi:hypothetical protein
MQITNLPEDVILYIESCIKDIVLLENLIFVNKYFRQIFMAKLNSRTLNYFGVPFHSYIYYSSDVKEKIFQEENKKYELHHYKNIKLNGIKIGFIEKCNASEKELSCKPYWVCWCYISPEQNKNTLTNKQFGITKKLDIKIYRTYPDSKRYIVEWKNHPVLFKHLTQYFTKEMAIEQVIYHYKQLSIV